MPDNVTIFREPPRPAPPILSIEARCESGIGIVNNEKLTVEKADSMSYTVNFRHKSKIVRTIVLTKDDLFDLGSAMVQMAKQQEG